MTIALIVVSFKNVTISISLASRISNLTISLLKLAHSCVLKSSICLILNSGYNKCYYCLAHQLLCILFGQAKLFLALVDILLEQD